MSDLSDQLAATHAAAFSFPRPWSAEEFEALLQQTGVFLVGDANCFALGRSIAQESELLTIATHPTHQRQGRARVVLGDFLDHCRADLSEIAFLEVAQSNAAAQRLYEGAGFVQTGLRANYYTRSDNTKEAAIVMSRSLNGNSS